MLPESSQSFLWFAFATCLSTVPCTEFEIRCGGSTGVPLAVQCDGHKNCTDGIDERDCNFLTDVCYPLLYLVLGLGMTPFSVFVALT